MNDGPLEDQKVVCPMHLYAFDTVTGLEKTGQCKKARIFKVVENGNDADIWL